MRDMIKDEKDTKISDFNIVVYSNEKYITYNSLTGNISVGERLLESIDKNKAATLELGKYGFIVASEEDEELEAFEKYYRYRFSSVLDVAVSVTRACNFRCTYCYQEHNSENPNMVLDKFSEVLRYRLRNFTDLNIAWFGGEPLLCFEQVRQYSNKWRKWCRSINRRYSSSITTNGYNLNLEDFCKLLDSGIISYKVTLDGLRDTHDCSRYLASGEGTYDRIINNLRAIRDFCKRKYNMTIRVNLSKKSLDKLDEIIEMLWNEFGSDRRFSFEFMPIKNWSEDCSNEMRKVFLSEADVQSMFRKMTEHKHLLNYTSYYSLLQNSLCFAIRENGFLLLPNGELHKCTILDAESKYGYIESKKLVRENGVFSLNKIPRMGKCKTCKFWANCFGKACPATASFQQENKCPFIFKYIDYVLPLIEKVDQKYNLGCIRY